MQKKQNPAARLRSAEVHLPGPVALGSWHHVAASGTCELSALIVAGGIDNQNFARAAADARKAVGKSGGLVRHRNDNRNLWRVVGRHLALNLARPRLRPSEAKIRMTKLSAGERAFE